MSKRLLSKTSLKGALIACASLAFVSVNAAPNHCKNVQYSPSEDTKMHIISYAEPEFDAPKIQNKAPKKAKSDVSLYSWLTESHTMPSLHFIEFIELFDEENG